MKCVCGRDCEHQLGPNIGPAQESVTGWFCIPLLSGGFKWICPECGFKTRKLAAELCALIGTTDVYLCGRWVLPTLGSSGP